MNLSCRRPLRLGLKRSARVDEVAAIAFVTSDDARYISDEVGAGGDETFPF